MSVPVVAPPRFAPTSRPSRMFCDHGARTRHSDKEKFRSDLNRPESREMSERVLKTLQNSGDFQAEYEGSIPFTRSKQFQ